MLEIKQRHMALLRDMGADILASPEMNYERKLLQHGDTSCYRHSIRVACLSLQLAEIFAIQVDVRSMIRGALLHDFFLYDWHVPEPAHRLHGITHPQKALKNAERLFSLNDIERDVIRKHTLDLLLEEHYGIELQFNSPIDTLGEFAETVCWCLQSKQAN